MSVFPGFMDTDDLAEHWRCSRQHATRCIRELDGAKQIGKKWVVAVGDVPYEPPTLAKKAQSVNHNFTRSERSYRPRKKGPRWDSLQEQIEATMRGEIRPLVLPLGVVNVEDYLNGGDGLRR